MYVSLYWQNLNLRQWPVSRQVASNTHDDSDTPKSTKMGAKPRPIVYHSSWSGYNSFSERSNRSDRAAHNHKTPSTQLHSQCRSQTDIILTEHRRQLLQNTESYG